MQELFQKINRFRRISATKIINSTSKTPHTYYSKNNLAINDGFKEDLKIVTFAPEIRQLENNINFSDLNVSKTRLSFFSINVILAILGCFFALLIMQVEAEENSELEKKLLDAAKSGDLDTLKKYANLKEVYKDIRDNENSTLLLIACQHGHLPIIEWLLDKKNSMAKIDERNKYGHTPLIWAAWHGQVQVISFLLKKGAKIEEEANFKHTALIEACRNNRLSTVQYLIKEWKANVKHYDSDGNSPVLHAAERGHFDIVKCLIEEGGSTVDECNNFEKGNFTAALLAAKMGHWDIVKWLVEKKGKGVLEKATGAPNDISADDRGCTPLLFAASRGNIGMVAWLITMGADINAKDYQYHNTTLLRAAKNGHLDVVKWLIGTKKADKTQTNYNKQTALQLAETNKQEKVALWLHSEPLLMAAQRGDCEAIKEICKNKTIDINISDYQGNTPLHLLAIKKGNKEILKEFLKKESIHQKANFDGNTPLHLIAEQGYEDLIDLMIKKGGYANHPNNEGQTPVHFAARAGNHETIRNLRQFGEATLDARDATGKTPMHLASEKKQLKTIQTLLALNADLTITDHKGYNIIHSAISAKWDRDSFLTLLNDPRLVRTTLFNMADNEGLHPLHLAAKLDQIQTVKSLYGRGVDLTSKDKNGNTALHYAALYSEKNLDLIWWLGEQAETLLEQKNTEGKTPFDISTLRSEIIGVRNALQTLIERKIKREKEIPLTTGNTPRIRNLVFQGGGVKGIAYVGALDFLKKQGIDLQHIERVGGTSAGAITALLIGLGYNLAEIKIELKNMDIKNFLDGKNGLKERFFETKEKVDSWTKLFWNAGSIIPLVEEIRENKGIFDGEEFRKWAEGRVFNKTDIENTTFEELHDLKVNNNQFKDIYFIGTNITTSEWEIFSYETTPKMIIADALRISMSIPIIFKPHPQYNKTNGVRQASNNKHFYVDGGISYNYPINLFDRRKYVSTQIHNHTFEDEKDYKFNEETLGLRLVSMEKREGVSIIKHDIENKNTLGYIAAILAAIYDKQEGDYLRGNDNVRTILIETMGISTLDFDIDEIQKQNLINSGEVSTRKFWDESKRNSSLFPTLATVLNKYGLKLEKANTPQAVFDIYQSAKSDEIGILKNLFPIDITNTEDGQTALHIAAKKGRKECTKMLIEGGADIEKVDKNGETFLDRIAKNNHVHLLISMLNNQKVMDAGYKCANPERVIAVLRKEYDETKDSALQDLIQRFKNQHRSQVSTGNQGFFKGGNRGEPAGTQSNYTFEENMTENTKYKK